MSKAVSRKDAAKRVLTGKLEQDVDYKCSVHKIVEGKGGNNREQILLTTNGFKTFCLMANTEKGNVMDNASTHGTKEVRNIIQQTGNKLLHSLPYSPETNSIEEFFNQFKHYIRRQKPQNIEELKTAIQYSLKEIKKRGCCRNYFVHAYEGEKSKIRKPRTRPAKKYKAE